MKNNYLDKINKYRNCRATTFYKLKNYPLKEILRKIFNEIDNSPLFKELDRKQKKGLKAEVMFKYKIKDSVPALDYGDKTDFIYKNVHIDVTANAHFKHDSDYFDLALDSDYLIAEVDINTAKIKYRKVADLMNCPQCHKDSVYNILNLYQDEKSFGIYSNYQQVDGYCINCSEFVLEQIGFFSYSIFNQIDKMDYAHTLKLFSSEYGKLISAIARPQKHDITFDGDELDLIRVLYSHPYRGSALPDEL
jgi:hypothetical protein